MKPIPDLTDQCDNAGDMLRYWLMHLAVASAAALIITGAFVWAAFYAP